jgi:hypothetical protein
VPDVFVDADYVIIILQVAQARVSAAESSVQIAYLSINDRVELDIKYADELSKSIAPFSMSTFFCPISSGIVKEAASYIYISNTSILNAHVFFCPFHQVISSMKLME